MSFWRIMAAALIFFAAAFVRFYQPQAVPALSQTVQTVVQTDGLFSNADGACYAAD